MAAAIYIALILISVGLVAVVILQAKGAGLGGIFGGTDTVYKSRRGVEKTLFQLTILLAVLFFLLDFIAVILRS
ncbi:MAG: preprotein translocase subunit SecG [Ardenticatenaceae bacterium]|nr:preprotein translocase subunit SecG [Ardenticatenaceae bacterium]HBY94482.1 preprotein translocase subunit SecG [Chloroflexota bacterium]